MSGYGLTRRARQDILEIWKYIARDNPDAADRVEQAIYDACSFVAESPGRGHTHTSLTTRALRFWTLPKYDPEAEPVTIIAVMHGKRNLSRLLRRR